MLHPRLFLHPFTPDPNDARPTSQRDCGVTLDTVVCALPREHHCHQQPLTYPEPTSAGVAAGTADQPVATTADGTHHGPQHGSYHEAALEDLLATVYLYVGWRSVTRHLTTDQKNLWADILDAEHARLDEQEGTAGTDRAYGLVDRWWRE